MDISRKSPSSSHSTAHSGSRSQKTPGDSGSRGAQARTSSGASKSSKPTGGAGSPAGTGTRKAQGFSSQSSFETRPAAGRASPQRATFSAMSTQGPARASPTDGIRPAPAYADAYQPHQVTSSVSVPTKVGVHWGPATSYTNEANINAVADSLKARGVGFATVIVNSDNVQGQAASIKALLDRGIEPVIRLLPGGNYNKTMDQVSDAEMESMANAAKQLKDMGVKLIQLDNEPNHEEGGKTIRGKLEARYGANPTDDQVREYTETMDRYASNLAKTLSLIEQKAPGTAVGFGAFAPGQPKQEEMFNDLIWRMKAQNDATGGKLLQNAWLAVHPYSVGAPGDGVKLAEHWRETAEKVLGPPMRSLSTEGGNPIRQDRAAKEKPSSDINLAQLREVAQDPNATQNYWLVGDQVLSGDAQGGPWEMDSLVYIQQENGQSVQKESLFFQNMLKVAQGEQP